MQKIFMNNLMFFQTGSLETQENGKSFIIYEDKSNV